MGLDKQFVDRVRDSADIVDIVGRSVPLKKAGREYSACCPFHDEKSPSFTVSSQKQFYHCFGCGAHGNAITFLMEYQGLTFPEAVKQLAHEAGIPIPEDTKPTAEAIERRAHEASLMAILEKASLFFKDRLAGNVQASQYVSGRGIAPGFAAQFALGYADKDIASAFLDLPTALLIEAGLLAVRESTGEVIDKFRRRIMFPIQNEQGAVIGFGGRTLGDEQPKYLNSPESAVFHKGSELYGLHLAKAEIRKARTAVVLEGYTDVIMMHQHGETRAVAGLGTSVTDTQIARLYRMADVIVFCFDGDNAGRKAADRAARMVAQSMSDGKSALFLTLPSKEDPDSFIQKFGIAGWEHLLKTAAAPLSGKLTDMLVAERNMALPEVKAAVAVEAVELLGTVKKAPNFQSALATHFEGVLGFALQYKDGAAATKAPAVPTRTAQVAKTALRPLRQVETTQRGPVPSRGTEIGIAPGPDDLGGYMQALSATPVPDRNASSFYKNFALYLALGGNDIDQFPVQCIDEFAGVISAWFAVAPSGVNELDAMVNSTQQGQLRLIVREAVARMRERVALTGEQSLEQELDALVVAVWRDAERVEQAKRSASLFD